MKTHTFFVLILSLVLSSCGTYQQSGNYWQHAKNNWPTTGLMFTSGSAHGLRDALEDKYSSTVFSNNPDNAQWWNPYYSWENKYRDWPTDRRPAYLGAKTFLVWTTDAEHMANMVRRVSMTCSVYTYNQERDNPNRRWWWYLADFGVNSLAYSAGFHVTQAVILK